MIYTRPSLPRRYIRAGFFFALGVVLLALLAVVVRRFAEATLGVITPFVIAAALALMMDPIVDRLTRQGIKRGPAAGIVFGIFMLLLLGIGFLTVPLLISQASDLATNGPKYIDTLQRSTNTFLQAHHKVGPVTLPANVAALSSQFSARVSGYVSQFSGGVMTFLIGSVSFVVELVLTLILTFYFLVDIDRLRARLFYLAPKKWRGMMSQIGSDVGDVFSGYLRGLLIVCALYGVATIGMLYGLSIMHHTLAKYALLVGVSAGLLYAVPYLGSSATALVTFIVAYEAAAVDGSGALAFGGIAVALTLLLNQIFDNIVTPRVVGGGAGLNPIVALFALVIGAALFGLTGMLLSVPIAGSIQAILFRVFPRLNEPTPEPFLHAQGVRTNEAESEKILEGDQSKTAANKRQEKERQKEETTETVGTP